MTTTSSSAGSRHRGPFRWHQAFSRWRRHVDYGELLILAQLADPDQLVTLAKSRCPGPPWRITVLPRQSTPPTSAWVALKLRAAGSGCWDHPSSPQRGHRTENPHFPSGVRSGSEKARRPPAPPPAAVGPPGQTAGPSESARKEKPPDDTTIIPTAAGGHHPGWPDRARHVHRVVTGLFWTHPSGEFWPTYPTGSRVGKPPRTDLPARPGWFGGAHRWAQICLDKWGQGSSAKTSYISV